MSISIDFVRRINEIKGKVNAECIALILCETIFLAEDILSVFDQC